MRSIDTREAREVSYIAWYKQQDHGGLSYTHGATSNVPMLVHATACTDVCDICPNHVGLASQQHVGELRQPFSIAKTHR